MAETACLMQPFSYASGPLNEAKEGNPIQALRDSVSFGRFVSESLAWEKWSSFSHNRYVEEAEKYAQPGSVAQKKAFFEAHYKRLAAKKAEALLEQAKAAANHVPEPEFEGGVQNSTTHNSQTTTAKSQVAVDEEQEVKATSTKAGMAVDANEYNANPLEKGELEVSKVEGDGLLTENQVVKGNSIKVESSSQLSNVENNNKVTELELCRRTQVEKPPLKKNSNSDQDALATSKRKPVLASSKSSVYNRASKLTPSPAKPISTIPRKENNATPISRKSAIDSADKKRSTPRSLHMSINSTPTRETNKLISPATQKIETSRIAGSSLKPSKDCLTPIRTPTTASVNMARKHSSATPQSENRRVRTPVDPLASGSRTVGPKWGFLSVGCSKSPSVNKSHSPNVSTPFILKTDERAARRKKLEEKFNAKEAQKVQLQTKLKERAESELRKLRQSLCFKARPLPDFYKERETQKNQIKKIPLTRPESPKLGRKPTPSTVQGTTTLPPRKPSIKTSSSKHVLEKDTQSPIHSRTSLAEIIAHENRSPNIQLS
ncbi:hypothetical protein L1049_002633 [Liquidambar formosana]|uniref:TPX2 C-terminal domain-containing protein n=1 Tax=Liquidambar formosana TaxID=63359 RepID=A0AAP0R6V8_LIQFO